MCPDALENPSEWIENIIDVYGPTSTDDKYIYSEIFCKWWGDLFLGMGPVVTADQYSEARNEMFMYEMTHRSLHSHDGNYSGKLKLKPRWSGCDQGDVKFSEAECQLSRRMMNYWANFARSGNPGWSQYSPQTKIRKILSIEEELICEW